MFWRLLAGQEERAVTRYDEPWAVHSQLSSLSPQLLFGLGYLLLQYDYISDFTVYYIYKV